MTGSTTHDSTAASRFWLRVLAGCGLLVGLCFAQDPGFVVADTKFDLVGNPLDFLGRALHLWDAEGAFGQLQNQAYGYLWPMGPFFLLGWLADVPAWAVQRLWQGLVLSVAFAGAARAARALGVRSDLACLVAGFAFALSPRMISTLGPISIEAWPSAIAPWVLLALVRGSTTGSPRRAAALAALGVAMVGGVNAAATFAVIPLGVVWVLTRTPGPRRRSLMLWWPAFTLLGTAWWLVPLFVMGAYSPPFLDFIETSSVTTFPTTVFDALRGTSNWVPYVDGDSRAGNDLITTGYLALNSGVVMLLGLVGLLDRRTPHRTFLALGLLLGLLMVTAGHTGSVQGFLAAPTADLLDGVLAPLRNVHKFDPVVRLPLVLGLAFVLDRAMDAWRAARAIHANPSVMARLNAAAFVGMVLAVVAGASLPALQGRVEPGGASLGVPDYWQQTADWLEETSGDGTALVVPGAPFADYVWGEPQDEPLQHLASSRWAVRNVIPLTPPGNIRMLDGIEQRLAQGRGSAGLTALLQRAGIEHLVVRNDLQQSADAPDPVLVHQAIALSPGLSLAAAFGPPVGGRPFLMGDEARIVLNSGWQARYPAVEVYAVSGKVAGALASREAPPVVAAGPEDLADLEDLGVLQGEPALLAADLPHGHAPEGELVLTDGLRARERAFARVHDGTSPVLTPGEPRRSGNPARDYLVDREDRWSTTARLDGARHVRASSSMSDAGAAGGSVRGELPFAALDGSEETAWVSGTGGSTWWEVGLETPRELTSVTLVGGEEAAENQVVRVRTDNEVTESLDLGPGQRRIVPLQPGDPVDAIRVEDASADGGRTITLAEVQVPGLRATRTLVLPPVPEEWGNPDTVVLRTDRDARNGCVQVERRVRCVESRQRPDEEATGLSRAFSLAESEDYRVALTVLPRAGQALEDLVLRDQLVDVTASTVAVPDARGSAVAAVDGDPGTTWAARLDDERPALTVSWLGTRTLYGLRARLDRDVAARRPTKVRLVWPGGSRVVVLPEEGFRRFPPIRTDQLRVEVLASEQVQDLGYDRQVRPVGVGVSELRVIGAPFLPLAIPADVSTLPCGSGPEVVVNGRSYRSALVGSPFGFHRGLPASARLCSSSAVTSGDPGSRPTRRPIGMRSGENTVQAWDTDAFEVGSVVLRTADSEAVGPVVDEAPAVSVLDLTSPSPVERTATPPEDATLLAVRENANPGWEATRSGEPLTAVVVDGWQQGWLLAASGAEGPVRMRFAPDSLYRLGLLGGAGCVLGLLAVLVLTRRRWAGAVPPALHDRALPPVLLGTIGLLGVGLLAGWGGLVVALLAAAATVLLRRRAPQQGAWLLAGCVLVAATAYTATPWGDPDGWAGTRAWPHYLALVPLAAVFVPWSRPRLARPRLPRPRSRIAGRSTVR